MNTWMLSGDTFLVVSQLVPRTPLLSYQISRISLTLVQWKQADHRGFVFGGNIVIFTELSTGVLFVECFRRLICSFGAMDNCDMFLCDETSSFSLSTFSFSYFSTASFLGTENPAFKILSPSIHTLAAWSIWNVMILGTPPQLGEFHTLVQSSREV